MAVTFLVRSNKDFENIHPDTQNIGEFTGLIAPILSLENHSKS